MLQMQNLEVKHVSCKTLKNEIHKHAQKLLWKILNSYKTIQKISKHDVKCNKYSLKTWTFPYNYSRKHKNEQNQQEHT